MKKYKKISKSKLNKMGVEERKAYYRNAIEYYGNLQNQLKGFKVKTLIHPLMLLITHFFPVKVIKLNNIDWDIDGLPVIFSANHSNSNDFPVLVQSIKKHCFALADYTMINDAVVCLATRMNGCVYVDRKSKKSTSNAFNQCVEGVKSGFNMVIFPESTWNLTKSLPILPRYWGDVKIAKETGSPIIPVIMVYCGNICLIKFGKRIYVSGEDSIVEKDKEVYNAMIQLKKEIQESAEYKEYYVPMEYSAWIKKNMSSYKYFDVDYELSCIRQFDILPQSEIKEIARIAEIVSPLDKIRKKLKYSRINYRYNDD